MLIIGTGGAGIRAAIELHSRGLKVLLVGKSKRRDAHTIMAAGGINAALGTMDPKDNPLIHAADTLKEGLYINDPQHVLQLCKNAPRAIRELEKWGMRFHRERGGKLTQRFFGAHTYRRTCFAGDQTGKEIVRTLYKKLAKIGLKVLDEIYIVSLLHGRGGRIAGALGLDLQKWKLVVLKAKAIALCTGGHSRCYARSTSRFFENTGDGVLLAYDAGAELMDMEMVQFHPTGMVWPKSWEGHLVSEAVRGEGGRLYNTKGERFMKRYYPERMELGPRDVVARANYREILAGRGTKHGGVWLDITHRPRSYIMRRLPGAYKTYKKFGIDISKQRMEVAPTAHYSMGGIRFNAKDYSTGVPGLYAIGEVTAGVHGGNRLGGNSLAEILVFGRFIGRRIAADIKGKRIEKASGADIARHKAELERLLVRKKGTDPRKLKMRMQEAMWKHAGVFRTAKELRKGVTFLNRAKKQAARARSDKKTISNYLDLQAILIASEAILRSALMRTESRAAHYRTDFPKTKASWKANIVCKRGPRGMKLRKVRVPAVPAELKKALAKKTKREYYFVE